MYKMNDVGRVMDTVLDTIKMMGIKTGFDGILVCNL